MEAVKVHRYAVDAIFTVVDVLTSCRDPITSGRVQEAVITCLLPLHAEAGCLALFVPKVRKVVEDKWCHSCRRALDWQQRLLCLRSIHFFCYSSAVPSMRSVRPRVAYVAHLASGAHASGAYPRATFSRMGSVLPVRTLVRRPSPQHRSHRVRNSSV